MLNTSTLSFFSHKTIINTHKNKYLPFKPYIFQKSKFNNSKINYLNTCRSQKSNINSENELINSKTTDTNHDIESSEWSWEDSIDALKAYGILIGTLSIGSIPGYTQIRLAEVPYFIALGYVTIYIGAHKGLNAKTKQQLTFKEAVLIPLMASVTLFGGYLFIKFFPEFSLQTLLNIYFGFLGTYCVASSVGPFLKKISFLNGLQIKSRNKNKNKDKESNSNNIEVTDIIAIVIGLVLIFIDLKSGHSSFSLNNLIASLIVTDVLQLIGLRSFKTAGLLLLGLLIYDVFWVFGSPKVIGDNVMLTVATSDMINGPLKVLFPKAIKGIGEAANFPFSLLGLGDIAIPGLLASLALRYDSWKLRKSRNEIISSNGNLNKSTSLADEDIMKSRGYFTSTMYAYIGGLILAFLANSITKLGQPALLYLVPVMLGTISIKALLKGDFNDLWKFNDNVKYNLLDELNELHNATNDNVNLKNEKSDKEKIEQ